MDDHDILDAQDRRWFVIIHASRRFTQPARMRWTIVTGRTSIARSSVHPMDWDHFAPPRRQRSVSRQRLQTTQKRD